MYSPVKLEDFAERMIEITVWDFDRIGASEFLGEVRVVVIVVTVHIVLLLSVPSIPSVCFWWMTRLFNGLIVIFGQISKSAEPWLK